MLIIGHRGAAGLAPENSLEAFRAGMNADADMLEFDVQRTRDGELLVIHDSTLFRTHQKKTIIRWAKYNHIQEASKHGHKIATLKEVLDLCFGKVILNLEIKHRGVAKYVIPFIEEHYIKSLSDWDAILFSSFIPSELGKVRTLCPSAQLALLHNRNSLRFMRYHRKLHFSAVGFNYKYAPAFSTMVAKQLGLFVYLYTINSAHLLDYVDKTHIDGIVTDDPIVLRQTLK